MVASWFPRSFASFHLNHITNEQSFFRTQLIKPHIFFLYFSLDPFLHTYISILKILKLMASGGDTWWLWLASSVENCLSSACLLVGVTLQMKMLRGAQQRRKKRKEKRRIETKSPYPLNCCGEAWAWAIQQSRRNWDVPRRGGTMNPLPPPKKWAEKQNQNILFSQDHWCIPQILGGDISIWWA